MTSAEPGLAGSSKGVGRLTWRLAVVDRGFAANAWMER
jgi:hypothetical protein